MEELGRFFSPAQLWRQGETSPYSDLVLGRMPELIEEFFSTPIPEKLWHYTTVDSLEGILSSQKIFATEAHHTTDPNEFVHARSVAGDYLARLVVPDEATRRFRDAGRDLLEMAFGQEGPLSPKHNQIFVASFSGSTDKRSQWGSYSGNATGVSIAFDLRGIRPPTELDSGISFAPCLYRDQDKEALLHEAINVWGEARQELYSPMCTLQRQQRHRSAAHEPAQFQLRLHQSPSRLRSAKRSLRE